MTDSTLPGLEPWTALATLTADDAPRFRFVVTPDDNPSDPIDWGQVGVVQTDRYEGRSNATPSGGTDPLNLESARDAFADRLPDNDAIAAAVIRWARVFHSAAVARWEASLSQSTWVDGLVYLEDTDGQTIAEQSAALEAYVSMLTACGRGEVYGVRLERATVWDEDSYEWATFQPVDECDIWGCYLENYGPDRYTPADVAVEVFDVPRAFAEAVEVVYSFDA